MRRGDLRHPADPWPNLKLFVTLLIGAGAAGGVAELRSRAGPGTGGRAFPAVGPVTEVDGKGRFTASEC